MRPVTFVALCATPWIASVAGVREPSASTGSANVVVIVTDDQGFGDFGFLGNEAIQTPSLDRMANESAWTSTFYVTPVCGLTRAALMTGRYPARTGVVSNGLPLRPTEITCGHVFSDAGYRTGFFGKWHLGDHAPHRPQEMGFDDVLTFPGGIVGQLEDVPTPVRYTDPMLLSNGVPERKSGYATDVFFDAALSFIDDAVENEARFLCVIATNAPHAPLDDVPEDWRSRYAEAGANDELARVYAMVSKIDENVGRLLARLDELDASKDTLVLFLSDNGPTTGRFNGELRGGKGSVLEGGVRVPLIARWPGRLEPGERKGLVGAHVDLLPTIASAAGLDVPAATSARWDGISLLDALASVGGATGTPAREPRALFLQAQRDGDLTRNYAVRLGSWKLVHPDGFAGGTRAEEASARLYDIPSDPGEEHDLAADRADVVADLEARYAAWLARLGDAGELEPTRDLPTAGAEKLLLTRSVAHGELTDAPFEILVTERGKYRLRARFAPLRKNGRVEFEALAFPDGATAKRPRLQAARAQAKKGDSVVETEIRLDAGRVEIRVHLPDRVPWQLEVERL